MLGEAGELAALGAAALVNAASTDVWQTVRTGFMRLFGRGEGGGEGDEERGLQLRNRLDDTAAEIEGLPPADRDEVRRQLEGLWASRLGVLLAANPEAAQEFAALIRHVQAQLPAGPQSSGQTNIAQSGGVQYISQHGDIHVGDGGAARP
ncbi:hypothetical protein [Streptomyces sp. ML-6]|uniref:hypothetical protein n=1 Tax=unclassified Streptomyces TaxID=2593676 RepID=UPI0024C0350A|nr:hypothetical protein [Streptomyces sp. ML-6]MDK0520048.1 hypothetical protein [Streptomyces sp. ML-6]